MGIIGLLILGLYVYVFLEAMHAVYIKETKEKK